MNPENQEAFTKQREVLDMSDPKFDEEERMIANEFTDAKIERREYHKKHGHGDEMRVLERALIDSLHHPTVSSFFQNKESFIEKAFPYLSPSAKDELIQRLNDLEDHFDGIDLSEQENVFEYRQSDEFKELFSFIHRWYQLDPIEATRYLPKREDMKTLH